MPLPFHWLFRRETWVRFSDACFPERKIRKERLAAVITGLRKKKKFSDTEIAALFKSHYGASLRATPDGPILGKSETLSFEQIVSHLEQFLESRFRDHGSFCHNQRVEFLEERRAAKELEKMFSPKSAHPPKSTFSEGAVRGLYMGQMLNEQRETNEHLERLRDTLGGS